MKRKAAILNIHPELFRVLFQLPQSTKIVGANINWERQVINVMIEGCGWEIEEGQAIPHVLPTISIVHTPSGRASGPTIDWGFPDTSDSANK